MHITRIVAATAIAAFSGLGAALISAAPAHAAGPDLAISVTQADSPASDLATRVTITVDNVGDATSDTAEVAATASGTGVAYYLVAHPGWTCDGLPLAQECSHAAIAHGASASALSVDLLLTNGPVTFTATVTSTGDADASNNSVTFTVQPRVMVVTGKVWSDDNGDGRQDAGEASLGDVKLNAYIAGTDTLIKTEWTFGDRYQLILPNVAPNITIKLDEANEEGRDPTLANIGPGDDLDSDFPADRTVTIPFVAGAVVDLDAGLLPKDVSPSPSTGGGLPVTGVSTPLLLATSALLLILGALLLTLRTKRSHR